MILAFELSMPSVGSWNGKWSGEENLYIKFRTLHKQKAEEIINKNYSYRFDDGWAANIKVYKVDSKTKNKLEKRSRGFMMYEWMIENIIIHGEIDTR